MQNIPQAVDYIIVGGGTAGNVVAARLAERGHSVLVLEAGKDVSAEPEVKTPGLSTVNFINPDKNWSFMSTPQTHVNGRQIFLPRGKCLGGSSIINFMQLNHPGAQEFDDAFKSFGIDGWSWNDLLPYFKKFEKLNTASPIDTHIQPDLSRHGDSGPVEATVPVETTEPRELFFKVMNEIGVETNRDMRRGKNVGVWNGYQAIDSVERSRMSSDRAYLQPNLSKLPDLHVVTEAHVTRVLLSTPSNGSVPAAEGVEFLHGGEKRTVKAAKEVIVSAGSYHTPQVLELSGIGDPSILSKHGIQTLVESPGDHILAPTVWELPPEADTYDALRNDPAAAGVEMNKYQTEKRGKFAIVPLSFATLPASKVVPAEQKAALKDAFKESAKAANHPLVNKMVDLQLRWMENDDITFTELVESSAFYPASTNPTPDPSKRYFSIMFALQFPLSRGTVHITSTDPTEKPAVDPQFFSRDSDLQVMLAAIKLVRSLVKTKTFGQSVLGEVSPGKDAETDDQLKEYIKNNLGVVFHPVGTAAMLPKELGGVVDKNLKVYGADKLRVVDASIFPIEFSVHPLATIYAMAEKAADIISGSA